MIFTFHKMLYLIWGIFFAFWFLASLFTRSKVDQKESLISRLLYLALLGVAIALIVFDPLVLGPLLLRIFPEGVIADSIGFVIIIAGLGFAVWARLHLGRYWSARVALAEDHQLIQTGPYRFVRNPIYFGALVAVLGTVLVVGEVRGVIGLILALIAFLYKIRQEESGLRQRFGFTYIEYQKKVKALIPLIY